MFGYLELIVLASTISNGAIAVYGVKKGRDKKESWLFAAFVFSSILWIITNYISLLNPTLHIVKLVLISVALLCGTQFLFSYYHLRKSINTEEAVIALGVISIVILLIGSNSVFSEIVVENNNAFPVPAPGIIAFTAFTLISNIASFSFLTLALFRHEKRMLKVQTGMLLGAFIIYIVSIFVLAFVLVNIHQNIQTIPIAMMTSLLFNSIMLIAITRYRYFDSRVTIQRDGIRYSMWIIVILGSLLINAGILQMNFTDSIVWTIAASAILISIGEKYILSRAYPTYKIYSIDKNPRLLEENNKKTKQLYKDVKMKINEMEGVFFSFFYYRVATESYFHEIELDVKIKSDLQLSGSTLTRKEFESMIGNIGSNIGRDKKWNYTQLVHGKYGGIVGIVGMYSEKNLFEVTETAKPVASFLGIIMSQFLLWQEMITHLDEKDV